MESFEEFYKKLNFQYITKVEFLMKEAYEKELNSEPCKRVLTESPNFYEFKYDLGVDNLPKNVIDTKSLQKNNKPFDNFIFGGENYSIYKIPDREKFLYKFVNEGGSKGLTLAIIKFTESRGEIYCYGLCQSDIVQGLISRIINEWLPTHYSAIYSGTVANSKGKNFWQNLAKNYIESGKKVTVTMRDGEIPYKLEDAEEYWKGSDLTPDFDKRIKLYF